MLHNTWPIGHQSTEICSALEIFHRVVLRYICEIYVVIYKTSFKTLYDYCICFRGDEERRFYRNYISIGPQALSVRSRRFKSVIKTLHIINSLNLRASHEDYLRFITIQILCTSGGVVRKCFATKIKDICTEPTTNNLQHKRIKHNAD